MNFPKLKLSVFNPFMLLIIFIFFLIGLIFSITDDHPLVINISESNPQSLIDSKHQVKHIIQQLNSGNHSKISFTHTQIEHLFSYLSHSFPKVLVRYNYSSTDVLLALSIRLPSNPFGNYVNISSEFQDGNNLFSGSSRIGGLSVSNELIINLTLFTASLVLDIELVKAARKLLNNTSISADKISVEIGSEIDTSLLVSLLKKDLKKLRDLAWDDDQFSKVNFYYDHLINISRYTQGIDKVSLFDYLKPLFKEVKSQSAPNRISEENTDALIALALFAGDYRLRRLISQIINIYPSTRHDLPDVLLAGRKDLMLHFIYSATFQIFSNRNLSLAVGELKEITDMDQGGSGFSFTDLAADRAGVQFAIMATDRNGGDSHLQYFIAQAKSENSFIPDILGLPDQLSYSEFEMDYLNTNSPKYKIIVDEIDRRIRLLSLYKSYR